MSKVFISKPLFVSKVIYLISRVVFFPPVIVEPVNTAELDLLNFLCVKSRTQEMFFSSDDWSTEVVCPTPGGGLKAFCSLLPLCGHQLFSVSEC